MQQHYKYYAMIDSAIETEKMTLLLHAEIRSQNI